MEIAESLIAAGASLDEKDKYQKTALIIAARYGRTEIAKLLIAAGASLDKIDAYRKTALIYAA